MGAGRWAYQLLPAEEIVTTPSRSTPAYRTRVPHPLPDPLRRPRRLLRPPVLPSTCPAVPAPASDHVPVRVLR
ncbi:hypothetical protein [Streptomyces sp. NPDC085529]|uniref:hypothetical protein n=1 Tax=Streptomyces sp. NPDC085529 TaxID=3365729 RepID=UPI0037D01CF8